jgi:UDP-N-acetylglucosamine transferase subunit ALG13
MNLFVTVGYQMSFDRLIAAVDSWVAEHRDVEAFAQIGPTGIAPESMDWERFLEPDAFRKRVESCDAMVAHAGMGSIITAFEYRKPILIMPRKGSLQETRNDHQLATARQLGLRGQTLVAMEESALPARLDQLQALRITGHGSLDPSPSLIEKLRAFIHA